MRSRDLKWKNMNTKGQFYRDFSRLKEYICITSSPGRYYLCDKIGSAGKFATSAIILCVFYILQNKLCAKMPQF